MVGHEILTVVADSYSLPYRSLPASYTKLRTVAVELQNGARYDTDCHSISDGDICHCIS